MNDDIEALIVDLRSSDTADMARAFGHLRALVSREPEELIAKFCSTLSAEHCAGDIRTPRQLTLVGIARVPAPECRETCLRVLRRVVEGRGQYHQVQR